MEWAVIVFEYGHALRDLGIRYMSPSGRESSTTTKSIFLHSFEVYSGTRTTFVKSIRTLATTPIIVAPVTILISNGQRRVVGQKFA